MFTLLQWADAGWVALPPGHRVYPAGAAGELPLGRGRGVSLEVSGREEVTVGRNVAPSLVVNGKYLPWGLLTIAVPMALLRALLA